MISRNIAQQVLFSPIDIGADKLCIISGYSSPNMVSWLLRTLYERKSKPINIQLIVGMTSYDGINIVAHEGFKELHNNKLESSYSNFQCSYVYDTTCPVHSNLYIWVKNDKPIIAYLGSANFTQSSFLSNREELLVICDPQEALEYYKNIETKTIFCNHSEVEEYVVLHNKNDLLDDDGQLKLSGEGVVKATLPLLTRKGDVGTKSGLNWGQRNRRNRNQAYIPLPSKIAKQGFFPLEQRHFTAKTDDGIILVLRVEQQGNKAITTPLSNAQLGEYFRKRLGLSNGAYVTKQDLLSYGRTNVTFYKIDDEEFFMDFSPYNNIVNN